MAQDLFQSKAKGYVLGIRGYAFNEFGQSLSQRAKDNLSQAATFIQRKIEKEFL